jgi:hypothetical protein
VVVAVTVTPLALLVALAAVAQEQVQELMLVVRRLHLDKEILVELAQTLQIMVLEAVEVLVLLVQTEPVLLAALVAQELHQALQELL